MTGPNHLWSGDWERESADAAADLPERPTPTIATPTVEEPKPEGRPRRRFSVKQLLLGVTAGLIVAAVAVALVISLGGSNKPAAHPKTHTATKPHVSPFPGSSGGVTPAQSIPTPVKAGPSAEWLGMQIVSSPSGAVVDTVRSGSPGDIAGFEPGDVISAIGAAQIGSVPELRGATAKLPIGDKLRITISRGSSTLTAAVTLRVRPTIRP
jgi:membrane-associated protease RseP (regulator of RpoE activity)